MKKIIFFALIISGINLSMASYGFTRWSASGLNGNEDREYYGEVVFSEKSKNVKMTQDDEYYYFDIEQDVVAPFSDDNYIQTRRNGGNISYTTFDNGNKMQIVLAPFANIYQLSHQRILDDSSYLEQSGFYMGGGNCFYTHADRGTVYVNQTNRKYYANIQNDIASYTSDGRSYPMCYFISNAGNSTGIRGQTVFSGWVEKNGRGGPTGISGYVTYNIPKVNDTDPDIPLTTPEVLSQSCQCVSYKHIASDGDLYYYVKGLEDIYRYKIKIKKDNLDVFDSIGNCISPFRYCNIVSKGNFDEAAGARSYPYCTSINNSIDLSLYLDCEHTWEYRDDATRECHTRYCSKCEWEKVEEHNFIYDYDNITHDRCACGTNKNIYITIKDNIGKINEKFIATPSCTLDSVEWEDVGYDFIDVTDKELVYTDIYDYIYNVSTISYIPSEVPKNSHEYNINYYTHRYYIHYNKTNNLNLSIENTMDVQVVEYGKRVKLDKSMYDKTGYTFVGWAVEPDLSTAVFDDEEEIYNISAEDGYILNLYPVYDAYSYIIRFTPGRGEGYMQDQVCTYGVCENIKSYGYKLDSEAVFINWKYNNIDIKPSVTTTLEPYVRCDNDVIVLQTNIYVRERNEKASYENSPTKKPDRGRVDNGVGPGINAKVDKKEVSDVVFVVEKKDDVMIKDKIKDKVKGDKDDIEKNEEDEDDDKARMYMLLASSSTIGRISNNGDIKGIWLLRGVLLAISIMGKMAFCMIFVLILVVFLATIIYGRKRIREHIKIYKN
ncbi:MAG: hypothetical protein MJ151_00315 [Lachnospiraceae bacterium]|nr:hypothetical protein [Lachnospiraceae bacterium]